MTQLSSLFNKLRRGGQLQPPTWLKLTTLLVMLHLSNIASAQLGFNFEPKIFDEYCPEVTGSYFIRTYLVYIQSQSNPWADALGAAELERRSRESMKMLNSVFNPYQIFFVASPPPGLSGNCYTVHTTSFSGGSYPQYDGGLTIQILRDDFTTTATGAAGFNALPAKYLNVGGNENGTPASLTPVLIHEVAHCLGLAHTFFQLEAGCDEMTDNCENNTLPSSQQEPDYFCNCCGDFVCDTEYNDIETNSDVLKVDPETCCCSVAPTTNIPPAIFKNYMSWSTPSRCRNQFTPGQIRRMRCYLYRADESVLEEVLITPETISGSIIWNTPQTKSGVIEVPSGATLTVNATLTMSPGSMIIVRRGGTLIVNSLITTDCGGMWGGIIVEGNSEQPQKEPNGQYSTAQGRIVLNQSGILEHATKGVGVQGVEVENVNYGGGIAELKGTIRNCRHGVQFERYRRDSLPNASYTAGATFSINDDYRGSPVDKPLFLRFRGINNLGIAATYFYDNRTQNCTGHESRADGLIAEDASFRVKQSYFRNLDHGILASSLPQSVGYGSYQVRSCNFQNCYTEILSSLPDPFSIQSNYFLVGRPAACPEEPAYKPFRGVHLLAFNLPTGIVLSDNIFAAGNSDEAEILLGIDCLGAGTNENFIRKNDFRGLFYGNRAAAVNGGATGLRYECNENTENLKADFYVAPGGTVRSIQGDKDAEGVTTAAGNKFINSLYSWLNEGTGAITYIFDATDPVQNPGGTNASFEGINPEPANQPNPNCGTSTEGCENPPCQTTEVSAWKSSFFQQKSAWLTKSALLPTLSGSAAETTAREIAAHRSAMDIEGGKVIRNYVLDSTGVKSDSVLTWTKHLQTYEADVRLARHHFFSRDFSTYYQWLDDIPTRNELSSAQTDELDELEQMLNVVRPSLQADVPLHRLPTEVLDALESWATECTEPGFIAKEILRRNGRKIISECEVEPEERPLSSQSKPSVSAGVRLYPNPAGNYVYVEIQEQNMPLDIRIVGLDGRIILQKILTASNQIDVSNLPPGIYLCRFTTRSDLLLHQKLVISR